MHGNEYGYACGATVMHCQRWCADGLMNFPFS